LSTSFNRTHVTKVLVLRVLPNRVRSRTTKLATQMMAPMRNGKYPTPVRPWTARPERVVVDHHHYADEENDDGGERADCALRHAALVGVLTLLVLIHHATPAVQDRHGEPGEGARFAMPGATYLAKPASFISVR